MTPTTPSGTRTRSIFMPFGRVPGIGDRADGVGEVGDDLEPGCDRRDPLFIERQPVEKCRRRTRLARLGEVLGIGSEDGGGAAHAVPAPCP